ncbi:Uncharacterised protein [Mycobacteroides abscessus subsp. abscessus]|nr:Uncharacterised protein [Mycobacteroides abscessus subsp. abscessus]
MKNAPTMMTSSTTSTLMVVMTRDTREDSLVPTASSTVSTDTMSNAPQSILTAPRCTAPLDNPNTVLR